MFCVHGVTIQGARRKAEKRLDDQFKYSKDPRPTPLEYQALVEELTATLYEKMSPERISGELSSPTFCEQYIASSMATTKCRALSVRIHVPKTDKQGGLVINKKSGKPTLTWEPYDPTKNYRAVIEMVEKLRRAA